MTPWTFSSTPFLIAGPCVIEADPIMNRVAEMLVTLGTRHSLPVCFKASFDKANRARSRSPRGPGLDEGLRTLDRIKREFELPVLTDVHTTAQVPAVAQVVDVIQVPAFLSRQTDLLVAAGASGLPVNVKKGQWMAPEDLLGAVEKIREGAESTGVGAEVAVTERGTMFGYGDLVVDFRNLATLKAVTGAAVVFDATHSIQRPGKGPGGTSGGDRVHVPALMAAAAAVGVDGFFLETHPDPDSAASDRETQWPLGDLDVLLQRTLAHWRVGK